MMWLKCLRDEYGNYEAVQVTLDGKNIKNDHGVLG